jgi:hypothetical protein
MVTCLAIPLVAPNPARRTLGGSRSRRRLTTAIENKQCKLINKQYLITKQIVPKDATRCYECVSVRIT